MTATGTPETPRKEGVGLVALFALAICLNAALLFVVEPMFTKMVLPLLGGAPSVWNTCLMFFQAALLVGYLYAHVTSRWMTPTAQGLLHVALLAVSLLLLPIALPAGAAPPAGTTLPIWWLIGLLARTLGLPFVLLAAGAPMLQRWFGTTRHRQASDPYPLYVASNLGSFAALVAYPTLIEPSLTLTAQRTYWAFAFGGLIALIVAAWMAARSSRAVATSSAALAASSADRGASVPGALRVTEGQGGTGGDGVVTGETGGGAIVEVGGGPPRPPSIVPTNAWRLRWILLSFAPSSLLLGVTTYLSTDIASVPFLWVVPLAIYLLSFVVVFARRPLIRRGFMLWFQLFVGLALMVAISGNPGVRLTQAALLHLIAFFATTLVLHRELADSRPRVEHLTEFYLWMSLGGLLGGVYNVLLAPAIYDRVLEYPYALIIAFGLRPGDRRSRNDRRALLLDLLLPVTVFAAIRLSYELPVPPGEWGARAVLVYLGVAALVVASFHRRPLRLALGAGAIWFGVQVAIRDRDGAILEARSFFGVYRVRSWDHDYHILQHGTTTHGGQALAADRRTEPLTYYTRTGPLGDIFRLTTDSTRPRDVALVGLGTGTTACYARRGERWTYFEIDPLVVAIAREPRLFTYLRDCQPNVRIVLGDARLSLAKAAPASYDLIVLDAFSSDAIPVHLITKEALAMYARALKPDGVIAYHISNRYLDLRTVLEELARDARMAGATVDRDVTTEERRKLWYASRWVVLARQAKTLAPLVKEAGWEVLPPSSKARLWTDDYSDVLGVMRWSERR